MGNSQNSVNIILDRPSPAIYYTGEFVSGRVQFSLSERTDYLNCVYLTLIGDAAFTRTRVGRIMNGQRENFTDRYDVRVLNRKVVLNSPISTSQHDQNGTIGPGEYQFPFSIRLPDVLPPTLHPEECPYVRYALEIFVEKRWYIPDVTRQCSIRVYPKVNLVDIPNSQHALKFNKTEKNISVKGLLPRAGFFAGEQTHLSLEISNPDRISIKAVHVHLMQHYAIDQCRRRVEIFQMIVPNLSDSNDSSIRAQCPIRFPIDLSPTYAFASKADSSGFQADVYYDLKLVFKLRKLFSDFDILVPIIIGTKTSNDDVNVCESHRSRESNRMQTSIVPQQTDRYEQPPPYESLYTANSTIEHEYYE